MTFKCTKMILLFFIQIIWFRIKYNINKCLLIFRIKYWLLLLLIEIEPNLLLARKSLSVYLQLQVDI